jgi:methylglutaconyl-CoA hydratase
VTPTIRLERERPGGVVARVTLDRPDVHNAFNATVIAELRTAFAALAREGPTELRAVILAGAGPSFCAGADVAWMRAAMQLDVEGNEQDAMAMADMFEAIDTCPAPVVARVHGAALGGGMGLCAVSDIVIAESGARFGFTETRLGILPAVISPFVIAKIGESHARALFPGGRRFDAIRAQRIGLVHEVVEGVEALDAAVDQAVADILASGPTAVRAAKAIVREVRGLGHGSAKWHTARVIARQRVGDEAQEGFRAFSEKRRPGRPIRTTSHRPAFHDGDQPSAGPGAGSAPVAGSRTTRLAGPPRDRARRRKRDARVHPARSRPRTRDPCRPRHHDDPGGARPRRVADPWLAAEQRRRIGDLPRTPAGADRWLAAKGHAAPDLARVSFLMTAGRLGEARAIVDAFEPIDLEDRARRERFVAALDGLDSGTLDPGAATAAIEALPADLQPYHRMSLAWSTAWVAATHGRPWRAAFADASRHLGPGQVPMRYLAWQAVQELLLPICLLVVVVIALVLGWR